MSLFLGVCHRCSLSKKGHCMQILQFFALSRSRFYYYTCENTVYGENLSVCNIIEMTNWLWQLLQVNSWECTFFLYPQNKPASNKIRTDSTINNTEICMKVVAKFLGIYLTMELVKEFCSLRLIELNGTDSLSLYNQLKILYGNTEEKYLNMTWTLTSSWHWISLRNTQFNLRTFQIIQIWNFCYAS